MMALSVFCFSYIVLEILRSSIIHSKAINSIHQRLLSVDIAFITLHILLIQKIMIPLLIHSKYFEMFNQFALLYASLGNSFLNVPNECMHELLASKPINSVYWLQNL